MKTAPVSHQGTTLCRDQESPSTILFTHIPKCGGTSLWALISSHYKAHELSEAYKAELDPDSIDSSFVEGFTRHRHSIRFVSGHYPFGAHNILGVPPCYLTVLREPIGRVVSFYQHLTHDPTSKFFEQSRKLSLKGFVEQQISLQTNNMMTRVISGARPFKVVREHAYLQQAQTNIQNHFLFAGILESVQTDIIELGQFLGWTDCRLPKFNTRIGPPIDLDEETKGVIAEHNELDIALYDWLKNSSCRLRPGNVPARTPHSE